MSDIGPDMSQHHIDDYLFFRSDMIVRSIGNSLMVILPDLVSKKITNWFDLVRPLIAFKFQTVSIRFLLRNLGRNAMKTFLLSSTA